MARELYELVGSDPQRRFSPYCWRARMALAHKGLDATPVPWRFTETERLAFANHDKVPVLVDGETAVGIPGRSRNISSAPIPTVRPCSEARNPPSASSLPGPTRP